MMTIADGAVLFGACVLSFVIGYLIGLFRVSRFVSTELHKVRVDLERQRQELQQFYSKVEEAEKP
jgi:hypothetical protein